MPPKKRPGYGRATEKIQLHKDYVRARKKIGNINRGLSSPSINEWRRGEHQALRDKWPLGYQGNKRMVKGKRICQKLKKGVHICNYYDDPNVQFRKGYGDKDGWNMGMAYTGSRALNTVEAAYPYRTTLHKCVRREPNGKCNKYKHKTLKKWEKMLHGVPHVELE